MNKLTKPVIKIVHIDSEVVVISFITEDYTEFFIEYHLEDEPKFVNESFDHAFGTEHRIGLDLESVKFDKIVYLDSYEKELTECPDEIKPYEISIESLVYDEIFSYFDNKLTNDYYYYDV